MSHRDLLKTDYAKEVYDEKCLCKFFEVKYMDDLRGHIPYCNKDKSACLKDCKEKNNV